LTTELSLFSPEPAPAGATPLAYRLRPETLDEFLGHEQLLGPGKPLREAIENGAISSMVLWGPPGCGKTTLAQLLARYTAKAFVTFSAVTEGVPRVREIIREAEQRRRVEGRGTILFCDEIHRFNKAQQDAFLPSVEAGVITLTGATTENPSFELNSALLSRLRVFVLEPLSPDAIRAIVSRGWQKLGAETGGAIPALADDALELLSLDRALARLESVDARLVRVVELRFFAGLEEKEIAETLGVSVRTVRREWALARAWLHRELTGREP